MVVVGGVLSLRNLRGLPARASRTEACQRARTAFLWFLRSFYDQRASERGPGGAGAAGGAGS